MPATPELNITAPDILNRNRQIADFGPTGESDIRIVGVPLTNSYAVLNRKEIEDSKFERLIAQGKAQYGDIWRRLASL